MFASEVITTLVLRGQKAPSQKVLPPRPSPHPQKHSQSDGWARSETYPLHESGDSFKDKNTTGESAAKQNLVFGVSF